jgi:methylenetetrahydrofolate reductase (NADPH)
MKPMKTDLRQALKSDRLVLTAECLPPRSGGADAVKRLASVLPPNLDAVVVADNPDEIHGSALACAALLVGEGRETVLTMSTRDRNRIALESDALGASALGIGAILCLSGNHQSLGVCPQAAGANDIDSIQLLQALKHLDDSNLLVGAVAHPYQQPLELNLLRLKKKVSAGADFVDGRGARGGAGQENGHHRKRATADQRATGRVGPTAAVLRPPRRSGCRPVARGL